MLTDKFVNQIIKSDNIKAMSKMPDNFVNLTITSPHYRNAIDYDMHVKHGHSPEKNYRGKLELDTNDYLHEMRRTFDEVRRITVEGGFCCIVIANEINHGTLIPLPAMLTAELVDSGWNLHEEYVWHKVTGGANRAGSFIKNPHPTYFRANIMHEKILVFRKGENRLRKEIGLEFTNLNIQLYNEIANSVWHIAPVPPKYLEHPCPYPEEIPYRLISLYSYPNDIVLDPFNGSGQTTKVAKHLGRKFIGIDIQKQYVDYAKKRLRESLKIRHESLVLEFDEEAEIPRWKKLPTWSNVKLEDFK